MARKLAMVEADLERAEERAESGEKYDYFITKKKLCVCMVCSLKILQSSYSDQLDFYSPS